MIIKTRKMVLRGRPPKRFPKGSMVGKSCARKRCGKGAIARGLCSNHYAKTLRARKTA